MNEDYLLADSSWKDLLNDRLVGSKDSLRIYWYPEDIVNASALPNGEIIIYGGLIFLFGKEGYWKLMGVLAHETAHFKLRHAEINNYRSERRQKWNNVWAGVTIGLMATSEVMSAYNSANAGVEYQPVNDAEDYNRVIAEAEDGAVRFHYRYSRDQETQADIVAIRLLQFYGHDGGEYVQALFDMYMDEGGRSNYTDAYDEHLSLRERISLLIYFLQEKSTQ